MSGRLNNIINLDTVEIFLDLLLEDLKFQRLYLSRLVGEELTPDDMEDF